MTTHPPTTIHTTTPLPPTSAHDFLAAYLNRSTTDPALQPDASITEHGPTSRTTASAPNLALHNLKRVQAGLGGNVLGRDLAVLGDDGGVRLNEGNGNGEGNGEWEDAKRYEQGDGDESQGGLGQGPGQEENADADAGVDKEERKRKKKERRLAEKRAKTEA